MSQPPPPAPCPSDQPYPWFAPRGWFRGSSNSCHVAVTPGFDSDVPAVSGFYRVGRGVLLNPQQGIHPEFEDPGASQSRPEKTAKGEKPSRKVRKVLDWLGAQAMSLAAVQEIAVAILRRLEQFHDEAAAEMVNADESKRSQRAVWAVDADRLMGCRVWLESIER